MASQEQQQQQQEQEDAPTLRQDLAALIRVRNRLAATSNAQLPAILEKLLPKLVTRINSLALSSLDDELETVYFECLQQQQQEQQNASPEREPPSPSTANSSSNSTTTTRASPRTTLELALQLEMMQHLHGMWNHVQERIQLLVWHSAVPPAAWVHAVWQALHDAYSNNNNSNKNIHPLTWFIVLPVLETAHACYFGKQQQQPHNGEEHETLSCTIMIMMPHLLAALEHLHAMRTTTTTNTGNTATQYFVAQNWCRISWMVLDAMAMAAGLPQWWDYLERSNDAPLATNALSWSTTQQAAQKAPDTVANSTTITTNAGLFALLLDVLLFVPNQHQNETMAAGGLSPAAIQRLQHRTRPQDDIYRPQPLTPVPLHGGPRRAIRTPQQPRHGGTWSDVEIAYWRHVKYAALRYAIPNLVTADQAMGLCLLLMAAPESPTGQLAVDYIWGLVGGRKLVRLEGQRFGPAKAPPCPVHVSLFLLGLIVGYPATQSAVQAAGIDNEASEAVAASPVTMECLAKRHDTQLQRTPISLGLAVHVLDYLHENMQLPFPAVDQSAPATLSLRLLVELAQRVPQFGAGNVHLDARLLSADPPSARLSPGMRWTMHLWYKLLCQINDTPAAAVTSSNRSSSASQQDEWGLYVQEQSWKMAMGIVSQVSDETDQRLHRGRRPDFGGRRNISTAQRLIQENRRQLGQRSTALQDCLAARREAYEVVARLVSADKVRKPSTGQIDFDPLICFMTCIANDTHCEVHQAMRKAAKRVTEIYMEEAQSIVLRYKESRQLMNALLFPLINTATSTSEVARELASVVAAHVLGKLDPLPARHLCEFLSRDGAPTVAKRANECLKQVHGSSGDIASPIKVQYMDLSLPADLEYLRKELSTRAGIISTTLGVPADAAFFLLRKESFSVTATIAGIQEDYHSFLRDCGLYGRLATGTQQIDRLESDEEYLCEICYETVKGDQLFSLCCNHKFCTDCWGDAIDASFMEGETTLILLTCPRHDCHERLARSDVEHLAPSNLAKMDMITIQDFITKSPDYSFCPGADCNVVACLASDATKNHPACCDRCNTHFCFQCGRTPHRPATCDVVKRYESIMQEFNDLNHIVKECPSCFVQIQKNGGCNHMTCSHCGHEFCWVCLSPNWSDHSCNIFDELEQQDDDNRRARFFSNRVDAHRMSERFAREGLARLEDTMYALAGKFRAIDIDDEKADILEGALKILAHARNFLLNSYIAAFGLNRDDAYRREFETHQAQVELLTERLDLLTQSVTDEFQVGEDKELQSRFKAILLTSGALSLYIRRVDLFMSNFMS